MSIVDSSINERPTNKQIIEAQEAIQSKKQQIAELTSAKVDPKNRIIYGDKSTETSSANKRHQQTIRLKAALAALHVLNKKPVAEDEKLSAELREFLRELDELQNRPRPEQNIITVNRTAGWAHAMKEIRDIASADIRRWTEEINTIESEASCQHKANKGPQL